jgi:4-amino-4-deoxy-L-arabinose transferase-like glycosyltransferase
MRPPTPHQVSRWRISLTILFCGLLAMGFRCYYVIHAEVLQPVYQPNVHGDAVDYYNYALNIVRHGVYSKTPSPLPPVADSYRDPGYPLLLAGWMALFTTWNEWYAAVLLSQAVLGGLTVTLLLAAARDTMPASFLLAAGILMAIWPHSVSMTSFLLTETFFGFLCALSLYLLSNSLTYSSKLRSVVSGAAFSAAALTNAALTPFAPLLAVYLFARHKLARAMAASLVVGAVALVLPWSMRNMLLAQPHESSSGRALTNLVQGSWPAYHGAYQAAMKKDPQGIQIMNAIAAEIAVAQNHPAMGFALIAHRMGASPFRYALWYLQKPVLFWAWDIRIGQGDIYVYPTQHSPFKTLLSWRVLASLCQAINPLLAILALAGAILVFRNDRPPWLMTVIAAMLIYVTVIYMALQSEPRYSVPFRGPEILLATWAAHQLAIWLERLRQCSRDANHATKHPT